MLSTSGHPLRNREYFRVCGRVAGLLRIVVSARGDQNDVAVECIFDGIVEKLGIGIIAQAHVNDLRTVIGRPYDALGNGIGASCPGFIQHLDRHNPVIPAHSGDPQVVVDQRSDDSGYMGPVADIIHGLGFRIDYVIAADQLLAEIRVINIDTGIYNGYNNV